MPADNTATRFLQVALKQRQPIGFFHNMTRNVFAAALISGIGTFISGIGTSSVAADLPQTFSDSPPAAPAQNQNPILQTNTKVLPVDSAFGLTTFIEADTAIVLRWEMPPGYYLYQKNLIVENSSGVALDIDWPEATKITDEFFGEVAVYYTNLLLRVPFSELDAKPGTTVDLLLTYQGCAETLYCYPPKQKALTLKLPE